jgi:hypothetical protein
LATGIGTLRSQAGSARKIALSDKARTDQNRMASLSTSSTKEMGITMRRKDNILLLEKDPEDLKTKNGVDDGPSRT